MGSGMIIDTREWAKAVIEVVGEEVCRTTLQASVIPSRHVSGVPSKS